MSDSGVEAKVPREHTIRLQVRQRDTDYLGIVYNPVYLDYAMEAVFQHVEKYGFGVQQLNTFGGHFVVRRHQIEYRRAARAGDELLVTTRILGMKGVLASRATRIVDAACGALVAEAKTDYVWVKESERPGRIPAAVLNCFDWEGKEPGEGLASSQD